MESIIHTQWKETQYQHVQNCVLPFQQFLPDGKGWTKQFFHRVSYNHHAFWISHNKAKHQRDGERKLQLLIEQIQNEINIGFDNIPSGWYWVAKPRSTMHLNLLVGSIGACGLRTSKRTGTSTLVKDRIELLTMIDANALLHNSYHRSKDAMISLVPSSSSTITPIQALLRAPNPSQIPLLSLVPSIKSSTTSSTYPGHSSNAKPRTNPIPNSIATTYNANHSAKPNFKPYTKTRARPSTTPSTNPLHNPTSIPR